ncbi:hypothetical protein EV421DRAFT_1738932 [Armillaria borealis]|uniref:Uncharacterized protein n=1 Tax=Armillaria borealis TaxID=47425 RepID=A0AA39MKJ0_9AGAR|nr:hypothetical protein EV421DRAFT_1738932 [Armillaria borealis]
MSQVWKDLSEDCPQHYLPVLGHCVYAMEKSTMYWMMAQRVRKAFAECDSGWPERDEDLSLYVEGWRLTTDVDWEAVEKESREDEEEKSKLIEETFRDFQEACREWSEYTWWLCDVGAWVNRFYVQNECDPTMNVPADDANIAILENGELENKRYMLPKVVSHRDAEVSLRENNLYPQQGAFPVDVPNNSHLAA